MAKKIGKYSKMPSSSKPAVCLLTAMFLLSATAVLVSSDAKFLLSCRVIAGICQGDPRCLDEMSVRFPDCYLESPFDMLPAKGADLLLAADGAAREEQQQQQRLPLDKRALKLMKVLMMKDRIPVGRR